MAARYKIVRKFFRHPDELISTGLTLEEAQEHCTDPESSSSTATTEDGEDLTRHKGPWFDAYYEE